MDVEVNYLGIFLATISAMVIGGIWYAKPVFGTSWMKLVSLDEEKAKKQMLPAMLIMLVGAFIKAWMLAHITGLSDNFYTDNSYFHNALGSAFAVWFGFVMVAIVTRNVFEQKPFKLTLILLGNEFVTFAVMGAIIGAVGI